MKKLLVILLLLHCVIFNSQNIQSYDLNKSGTWRLDSSYINISIRFLAIGDGDTICYSPRHIIELPLSLEHLVSMSETIYFLNDNQYILIAMPMYRYSKVVSEHNDTIFEPSNSFIEEFAYKFDHIMMNYIEYDIDDYLSSIRSLDDSSEQYIRSLDDSSEQYIRKNYILTSHYIRSLNNIFETCNDDKTSKYRNRINKFMVKNNIKILLFNIKPSDIEQLEKYCSQIQVVKPDENLERWLNRKK